MYIRLSVCVPARLPACTVLINYQLNVPILRVSLATTFFPTSLPAATFFLTILSLSLRDTSVNQIVLILSNKLSTGNSLMRTSPFLHVFVTHHTLHYSNFFLNSPEWLQIFLYMSTNDGVKQSDVFHLIQFLSQTVYRALKCLYDKTICLKFEYLLSIPYNGLTHYTNLLLFPF